MDSGDYWEPDDPLHGNDDRGAEEVRLEERELTEDECEKLQNKYESRLGG